MSTERSWKHWKGGDTLAFLGWATLFVVVLWLVIWLVYPNFTDDVVSRVVYVMGGLPDNVKMIQGQTPEKEDKPVTTSPIAMTLDHSYSLEEIHGFITQYLITQKNIPATANFQWERFSYTDENNAIYALTITIPSETQPRYCEGTIKLANANDIRITSHLIGW